MMYRQLALVALTLGLCGCAATKLKQTWKAPDYAGGPAQKIAVLAVDDRGQYRHSVESHFGHQLQQRGQSVFLTYDFLDLPAIKADKDAAAKTLRERGADTVLIVRLVSSTYAATQTEATPSRFVSTIDGYDYNNWYGCYSVAFTDMGTVWNDTQTKVRLETSLFDLKTERRIWTGITQTMVREQTDRIEELSKVVSKVIAAMHRDGMVR